jgi:serine/threonine protein kinase
MKHKKTSKKINKKQRITRRKYRGKGKVYTVEGEIENMHLLIDGKEVFRKMTSSEAELKISRLLKKYPHKNIVKIYHVGHNYVDMELTEPDYNMGVFTIEKIKEIMTEVKDHLQRIGVIYIDWKPDNMGLGEDGELKLFDFDCSGIIDTKTQKWKVEPDHLWSYKQAEKAGHTEPIAIDDYSFEIGIADT